MTWKELAWRSNRGRLLASAGGALVAVAVLFMGGYGDSEGEVVAIAGLALMAIALASEVYTRGLAQSGPTAG
jgi:hypothetical protein